MKLQIIIQQDIEDCKKIADNYDNPIDKELWQDHADYLAAVIGKKKSELESFELDMIKKIKDELNYMRSVGQVEESS